MLGREPRAPSAARASGSRGARASAPRGLREVHAVVQREPQRPAAARAQLARELERSAPSAEHRLAQQEAAQAAPAAAASTRRPSAPARRARASVARRERDQRRRQAHARSLLELDQVAELAQERLHAPRRDAAPSAARVRSSSTSRTRPRTPGSWPEARAATSGSSQRTTRSAASVIRPGARGPVADRVEHVLRHRRARVAARACARMRAQVHALATARGAPSFSLMRKCSDAARASRARRSGRGRGPARRRRRSGTARPRSRA